MLTFFSNLFRAGSKNWQGIIRYDSGAMSLRSDIVDVVQ